MKTVGKLRLKRRREFSTAERRGRCWMDRRSGEDNRKTYSLKYFSRGGSERREYSERRSGADRREPWEKNGLPCTRH